MRTLTLICLLFATARAIPVGAQPSAWAHLDSAKRLLPPDAYPELPPSVRRNLVRRGCRVPQASGPDIAVAWQRQPNNVVRGAFTAPGAQDWAVLCSVAGVSRILIYVRGRDTPLDSLAHAGDSAYLFREEGYDVGYYRVIGTATAPFIRRSYADFGGRTPPARLDHLGIEDRLAGKASEVYYFYRRRWLTLQGVD